MTNFEKSSSTRLISNNLERESTQGSEINFKGNTRFLSAEEKRVQLYQNPMGMPIWLRVDGLTDAGKHAKSTLQNADQEGLDALTYQPILKIISALDFKHLSPEDLMTVDIQMTQYVALYLEELHGKRLFPEQIDKEIHLKVENVDPYDILNKQLQHDASGKWLTTYTLKHQEYQNLKKLLMFYKMIQHQGGWPQFDLPADVKFEIGLSHPSIAKLKKQLWIQGDFKAQTLDDQVVTAELMSALTQFQRRHGLEDDGKIGHETRHALGISVEDRIQQILVSMERWRWAPERKSDAFSIMVNIVGYFLQGFDGQQKVLEMPVIVGQPLRQTPVFVSKIDFVRFNPAWYVPHSIAIKDKLPLLQSQPWYFKSKGYTIYDREGFAVDALTIDWTHISESSFSYKLIQNPGNENALGKIFFHMNTPFDIFFHGSSNGKLFKRAKRPLSSGCIRVEDPITLAQFVLQSNPKWTHEAIVSSLNQQETRDVYLNRPIQAYIAYQTVWVDDENLAHFVDDIYGQDKAIEIALKKQNVGKIVFN